MWNKTTESVLVGSKADAISAAAHSSIASMYIIIILSFVHVMSPRQERIIRLTPRATTPEPRDLRPG